MRFFFILFLLATSLAAQALVSADHDYFQFSGRMDFVEDEVVMYWPGSSIRANFSGSTLEIILDDKTGDNFYNVIIDGKDHQPVVLDCKKNEHRYAVADDLSAGEHSVLIFRRTEGFSGPTRFGGLVLAEDGELLPPPAAPERKIEFYGNSITCGMGNEAPDDGKDDDNSQRNNYLAYGAITARLLDAEYRCIAKSGIGIMISWFPMIMPEYYDRIDPADSTRRWDFSQWTPDVVVVNLFQNDSWLMDRLNPVPTDAERVAAYAEFIQTLRRHYPDAAIFCTLGSMDATKPGSPWPGYIEKAVAQRRQAGDENLYTYFFEFDGFSKHPRVRHHQKNAGELAAFIRAKVGW